MSGVSVRSVVQSQSPFMYAQAIGSTSPVVGVNPFSGLGNLLSSCYPEFNPDLIKSFEVRLSEGLAATQVPAILSQSATQENIRLGIDGALGKVASKNPQGPKGVEMILESVESSLFINPDSPDVGPVVSLQFIVPKGGKAALVISHKPSVPRAVLVGTFSRLSTAKKIDSKDLDVLTREVERLRAQLEDLERANEALRVENQALPALRKRLEEMNGELRDLRSAQLTSEIDRDLADRVPALRDGLRKANEDVVRLRGELKARDSLLGEKDRAIEEKSGEIKRVSGELESAKAEAERLSKEVDEKERRIQSGTREIERLTKSLDEAVRERDQIRREKEALEGQAVKSQPEREAQSKRLAELERAASASDKKIEGLNRTIGELTAKNEKLSKENAELKDRAERAEKKVGELEKELRRLNEEVIPDLRQKVETASAEAEAKRKGLASLEADVKKMREDLERERGTAQRAGQELERIRKLLEEANKARAELARRIAELSSSTDDAELKRLRALGKANAERISQLEGELQRVKSQLEQANKRAAEFSEKHSRALERIAGLEEELRVFRRETVPGLEAQLKAAQADAKSKDETIRRVEEETRRLRAKIGKAGEAQDGHQAEIERLRKTLEERNGQLETLRKQKAEADAEVKRLSAIAQDVDSLRSRVESLRRSGEAVITERDRLREQNERMSKKVAEYEGLVEKYRREIIPEYERRLEEEAKRFAETQAALTAAQRDAEAKAKLAAEAQAQARQAAEQAQREAREREAVHRREVAALEGRVQEVMASADVVEINYIRNTDPEKIVNSDGELADYVPREKGTLYFVFSIGSKTFMYVLPPGRELIIGSSDESDIVIKHGKMSAKHMVIKNSSGRLVVKSFDNQSWLYLNRKALRTEAEYDFTERMSVNLGGAGEVKLLSVRDKPTAQKVALRLTHTDEDGQERKMQYELLPGQYVTVGREDASFIINERTISRRHLVIYNDGGVIKVLNTARDETRIGGQPFRLVGIDGPADLNLHGEALKLEILSREDVADRDIVKYKALGTYNPPLVAVEHLIAGMQAEIERLKRANIALRTQAQQPAQQAPAPQGQVSPHSPSPPITPSPLPAASKAPVIKQKIKVSGADGSVWEIDLGPGEEMIIGRNKNSGIRLNPASISSTHCAVRNIGGNLYIIDLNSTNGTIVRKDGHGSGSKIPAQVPVPLVPGDTLTLGEVDLSIGVSSKGIPTGQFTAPVLFADRVSEARSRVAGNDTIWAAKIGFPQRLTSFSGLAIDTSGKKEIILVDYTSDLALINFLQEIMDMYSSVHDTSIGQIVRAFLAIVEKHFTTLQGRDKTGVDYLKPLSSYSSENLKALLLVLALQAAGIKAIYQGGVLKEKKLLGTKDTERAWVYIPDHSLIVDPVTGLQLGVTGYRGDSEITLQIPKSGTYSSTNGSSTFLIPTYERLEQNLIDILNTTGHYTQALKQVLVIQLFSDLREYDTSLKAKGQSLEPKAVEDKIKQIIRILTHFDAMTDGFDPILKGQLADFLRIIYLNMLQTYAVPSPRIEELLS